MKLAHQIALTGAIDAKSIILMALDISQTKGVVGVMIAPALMLTTANIVRSITQTHAVVILASFMTIHTDLTRYSMLKTKKPILVYSLA